MIICWGLGFFTGLAVQEVKECHIDSYVKECNSKLNSCLGKLFLKCPSDYMLNLTEGGYKYDFS